MDRFFNILRKTLVGTIVLVFAFVVTYTPQQYNQVNPAEAAIPTFETNAVLVGSSLDTALNTTLDAAKEQGLDGIFNILAKTLISEMLRSMVVWINSGFKGSPAFVQDLGRFLLDAADEAAGEYIRGLGDIGSFICSPFRLDIQLALSLKYQKAREYGKGKRDSCTLSGIVDNVENFFEGTVDRKNFWQQWVEVSSKPERYTPYGQMFEAEAELDAVIRNARGQRIQIANWGDGFLSNEVCELIEGPGTPAIIKKTEAQLEEQSRLDAIKRQEGLDTFINDMPPLPALPPPTGAMNTPASDSGLAGTNNTGPSILSTAPVGTLAQAQATTPNSAGAGAAAVGAGLAGAAAPAKQRCVISTPGKVISEQLNKALGAGQDQLVAADEINEVISALIGQLANQALMGTAGLLGLTPRTGYTAGGYGSGSYVDEMVEQTRRSAGSFIADGYNQLAEKLKLQEDYNAMAVEYLPRLLTVINNPLVTADVRDRARISYDDAITVKDTTAIHITKIKPLVVEFETLQRELSGGTVTEARKQAIISRQTQIISEGGTYRAYTEERMRASYREWSDITRI